MKHWIFSRKGIRLLPFILAVILVCSESVERSMYTDGVAYASIARNLSIGEGHFWQPRFSETIYPVFYGHPPLVFKLQSLVFELTGDTLLAERIYALLVMILTGYLMVLIWQMLFDRQKNIQENWFLPLLLWQANEVVYHFYPANTLEPTAGLFALGGIYNCLLNVRTNRKRYLLIAAVLVVLGVLSKGPVVLFPLAFFGIYWLTTGRLNYASVMQRTLLFVGGVVLLMSAILLFPSAREALSAYFELQIRGSMLAENKAYHFRENRFYIIRRTLEVLLPAIGICLLILGLAWRSRVGVRLNTSSKGLVFLFLLIGVSAAFPLALSPKQAYYYLLPSMPYFAIGLGIWVAQPVTVFIQGRMGSVEAKLIPALLVGLIIFAIYNTWNHWGTVTRRDRVVLPEIERMVEKIPAGSIIGGMGEIAPLVSYMQRLKRISIDTVGATQFEHQFLVAPDTVFVNSPFQPMDIETEKYTLYRKKLVSDQ